MPEIAETTAKPEYGAKKLQVGTRKQMRWASAPRRFWSYAMRTYCFNSNRRKIVKKSGKTAHEFTWNQPSRRELMPLGCELRHIPQKREAEYTLHKSDAWNRRGIFLGYSAGGAVEPLDFEKYTKGT